MTVWQHADDFRGTARVSTWIFGIAYRRALNSLRKSAARSRVLVSELEGVGAGSRGRLPRDGGPAVAGSWALKPASRAAPGYRPGLRGRPFVRRDRRDCRLPRQYGEDADVLRATQVTGRHLRGCGAAKRRRCGTRSGGRQSHRAGPGTDAGNLTSRRAADRREPTRIRDLLMRRSVAQRAPKRPAARPIASQQSDQSASTVRTAPVASQRPTAPAAGKLGPIRTRNRGLAQSAGMPAISPRKCASPC